MNSNNDFMMITDNCEYNKIAELAQLDPPKFERLRKTLLEQFLSKHPDEYGNLKLLQKRIEEKISQKNIVLDMQLETFLKEPTDFRLGPHRICHAVPHD